MNAAKSFSLSSLKWETISWHCQTSCERPFRNFLSGLITEDLFGMLFIMSCKRPLWGCQQMYWRHQQRTSFVCLSVQPLVTIKHNEIWCRFTFNVNLGIINMIPVSCKAKSIMEWGSPGSVLYWLYCNDRERSEPSYKLKMMHPFISGIKYSLLPTSLNSCHR